MRLPAATTVRHLFPDADANMALHNDAVTYPVAVQAHAWAALGKLCLTDEGLAKKCVPLLVQELGRAHAPAVRNNIIVALADMCIQMSLTLFVCYCIHHHLVCLYLQFQLQKDKSQHHINAGSLRLSDHH